MEYDFEGRHFDMKEVHNVLFGTVSDGMRDLMNHLLLSIIIYLFFRNRTRE